MSVEDKLQMFDDDSELSNIELAIMKTNKSMDNHRTFKEILDQCTSSIINLTHQGVRYFLTTHCHLKTLFLGQNQIANRGAEYLSEFLRTNQTLVQLGLLNNQISDQGMIFLIEH